MPPAPGPFCFPLFPDPIRENIFGVYPDPCDICGYIRGLIYTGPQFSPSPATDDLAVCPWCIADGSAAARGLTFNDGTNYPCLDSTPQLTPQDRELVECRTPGFVTWQGNHWLMCCGRACIYLGEADTGDLQGRWDGAVQSMFNHLDWPLERIDELVASVGRAQSPNAYVFQCQVCAALRGYWDRP